MVFVGRVAFSKSRTMVNEYILPYISDKIKHILQGFPQKNTS